RPFYMPSAAHQRVYEVRSDSPQWPGTPCCPKDAPATAAPSIPCLDSLISTQYFFENTVPRTSPAALFSARNLTSHDYLFFNIDFLFFKSTFVCFRTAFVCFRTAFVCSRPDFVCSNPDAAHARDSHTACDAAGPRGSRFAGATSCPARAAFLERQHPYRGQQLHVGNQEPAPAPRTFRGTRRVRRRVRRRRLHARRSCRFSEDAREDPFERLADGDSSGAERRHLRGAIPGRAYARRRDRRAHGLLHDVA